MNQEKLKDKLNIIEKNAKENLKLVCELRKEIGLSSVPQRPKIEETDFNLKGLMEGLAGSDKKDDKC